MSVFLDEYLRLEQSMLRLDAVAGGEEEADGVRDFMDLVWRRLPEAERQLLNERAVVAPVSRPSISVRVSATFISARTAATARENAPARHLRLSADELWCAP